jgi:hypothetical protein
LVSQDAREKFHEFQCEKGGSEMIKTLIEATLLLGCVLIAPMVLSAAVRGDQVMYVGGSITAVPEKTEGRLDTSDNSIAIFIAKKGKFNIAYARITGLEYGQKAGRRVGVAVAVSPVALLSKKRRHYLTVSFADEQGAKQGAVLEIGKGRIKKLASLLETRSGKTIEFESEEAKKHFQGN